MITTINEFKRINEAIIHRSKNIPSVGETITEITYNDLKDMCWIKFSSGKFVCIVGNFNDITNELNQNDVDKMELANTVMNSEYFSNLSDQTKRLYGDWVLNSFDKTYLNKLNHHLQSEYSNPKEFRTVKSELKIIDILNETNNNN